MFAAKEVPLIKDWRGDRKLKQKIEALRTEIQTLARIDHPNIVQYYGATFSKKYLYIHLEFVSGGSLYALLKEYGSLPVSMMKRYTVDILEGLSYDFQISISLFLLSFFFCFCGVFCKITTVYAPFQSRNKFCV